MKEKDKDKNITEDEFDKGINVNSDTKTIDPNFDDDYPPFLLNVDYTNVTFGWEENDELPKKPKKKDTFRESERNKTCDNPIFFLVKVRMANGQTYTVAKVPVKNPNFIAEEEKELFDHYCTKLRKKHLYVQKPFKFRCLRTSAIDELRIDSSYS